MSLVKVMTSLTDLDGTPFEGPVTTLRDVMVLSLKAQMQGDEKVSPETKYGWGKLARRIMTNEEVSLKAEEIVILKDRIGRAFNCVVVEQVFDAMEPYHGE